MKTKKVSVVIPTYNRTKYTCEAEEATRAVQKVGYMRARENMFKIKDYTIFPLAILALIGVVILLFMTRWGIGLGPDSTAYIHAARNLLNGLGLTHLSRNGQLTPMTHFPPLFPILLAMIGTFGMDPLSGARWLSIFLFGANILLVGLVIRRFTRDLSWTPMFGSFLVLASGSMLGIHSMALTEPLFIFFSLLGLFLLGIYFETSKRILLFTSSSAIALAFLARYAGVALIATGIVGVLFFSRKTYRRRIADSFIFAAISSFPMVLWIIRNLYAAGAATNRQIAFHPITFGHIEPVLFTLSGWLLPYRLSGVISGLFSLVVVLGLLIFNIILGRKAKLNGSQSTRQNPAKFLCFLGIFITVYGLVLTVSISFFDAFIPLDGRILSPVYVSGLVLILCTGHRLLRSMRERRSIKVACIILCIAFAAFYLRRGAAWILDAHADGRGYASKAWQHSEIMERIRVLPPGTPIFTNARDAVYIVTSKHASDNSCQGSACHSTDQRCLPKQCLSI
jgi:uncharacterized membrane protein